MNTKNILIGLASCFLLLAALGAYFGFSPDPADSPSNRPLPATSSAFFSPGKLSKEDSSRVNDTVAKTTSAQAAGNPQTSVASGKRASSAAVQGPLSASFQVEGKDYVFGVDQFGAFPRVTVPAGQKIPIHLQYAAGKADANEVVTFQTLDGGGIETKGRIVKQGKLNQQLSTDFNFVAGTQEGIYRVSVLQRGERKTLQFWVGPTPAMKQVAQAQ